MPFSWEMHDTLHTAAWDFNVFTVHVFSTLTDAFFLMSHIVGIQIFIKMLTGKIISLWVKASDTAENVKAKIRDEEDIPPDKQMLIFQGQQVPDGHALSEYNVVMRSEIHLIIKDDKG